MNTLCGSFQGLAAQTWRRLERAEDTGLLWSEETNTETILMELQDRHSRSVKVISFNRLKEAKNGADWEWWIGSPGSWFGMRVQAKRIALPAETFNRLQKYKAKKSDQPQIDVLIDAARVDKLNPAYCLYVFSRRWPQLHFWPTVPILGEDHISPSGCLIGHAQAVRAVRSDALTRLASVLLPWHLLVCSCVASGKEITIGQQSQAVLQTSAGFGSKVRLGDPGYDAETVIFPPRESLPQYVERMRDAAVTEETIQTLFRNSHAAKRRIAGLVVIEGEKR